MVTGSGTGRLREIDDGAGRGIGSEMDGKLVPVEGMSGSDSESSLSEGSPVGTGRSREMEVESPGSDVGRGSEIDGMDKDSSLPNGRLVGTGRSKIGRAHV